MAAIQNEEGEFVPKIKISENTEKITNPGNKTIYRIYEKESGKIKADLICFADEVIDTEQDLLLFDPIETWKKTKLSGGTYTVREILVPVFKNGECIYKSPTLKEIASYCCTEKDTLWMRPSVSSIRTEFMWIFPKNSTMLKNHCWIR